MKTFNTESWSDNCYLAARQGKKTAMPESTFASSQIETLSGNLAVCSICCEWWCLHYMKPHARTHARTHTLTLVIFGWVQRLFPEVACIQPPPSGSCSGRWEFIPVVHSCLREHFLSWTHQPHSNRGSAFRHMPQLSRKALHLYRWAGWKTKRVGERQT